MPGKLCGKRTICNFGEISFFYGPRQEDFVEIIIAFYYLNNRCHLPDFVSNANKNKSRKLRSIEKTS